MSQPLDDTALNQLFLEARTHNVWQDKDVSDDLLNKAWDLARWAPTSMNCNPVRITFIKTPEAKERLKACLSEGNIEKTMSAPATAIIATDMTFYTNMPRLFPSFPGAADMFENAPDLCEETATRNSTLQGAYFIMACRTLGLDCGPMSGFDNKKLDEEFFKDSSLKSNFLCNIGYGDKAGLYNRGPRPAFDEVCDVL
ncbi:malonic semialdehyde reductase [Terasakiella sp. SH-1]|uniref:malonic semialdehyde reductase n=1 Tax=Terasakiella sp. SH-1 TaxID=2560057 RepID=UPI0010739628|nr:malonic semialdehyde reductase [Terasakiella sp. SH-1]